MHNARYVLGVTSQHLIYGQKGEMGCCRSQCSGWGSTELVKSTPVDILVSLCRFVFDQRLEILLMHVGGARGARVINKLLNPCID